MKKYKSLIYFILLFSASCKSQDHNQTKIKEQRSQAELIVHQALITFARNNCEEDSIRKSIKMVKQAINLKNSEPIFYINAAQMYCSLNEYQQALEVLDEYSDDLATSVELETYKGLIFEKMGNVDSAKSYYAKAIKNFDLKIHNNPNNITFQLNRAFLLFFTNGENEAKMEFNRIASKFPKNENVKAMRNNFSSFNRETYINQIFASCLFPLSDKSSND